MKHTYYTCDMCGTRYDNNVDLTPFSIATFCCTTNSSNTKSLHHVLGEDVCSKCREAVEKDVWRLIEDFKATI